MFTLTGFADEISDDLDVQLNVLTELGLGYLELRGVWGKNVLALTDKEVETVKREMDAHNIRVSAIGSPIGKIKIDDPFESHLKDFGRAIELAEFFGCKYIRMFSFYVPEGQASAYRDQVMELNAGVLSTMANPGQLQQVFLNLINNAQEAMAEHGGGLLKVTSELCGETILVRFSDNGPGLSLEAKQHLFEPFFTTKEVGKGTGLGLSICFGIISQYGGRIWLDDEQTPGATFVVELPLAHGEPASFLEVEEVVDVPAGKRVLLVEDEAEIAMMLERVLLLDGHHVVVARNGEEALECLSQDREQGEQFDLIISDIRMPGLSGPDLYERLHEEGTEFDRNLVYMTGDTMRRSTRNFLETVGLPYLTKPFSINEFRRLLTKVLD